MSAPSRIFSSQALPVSSRICSKVWSRFSLARRLACSSLTMSSRSMLGVDLSLLQEEPVENLPGFGDVVLLLEVDQLVVLEHLVEGVEEGRGNLVAHRKGLQPGQAGVFEAVDAAAAVAVDEDVLVLVDDPAVVRDACT